MKARIVMLGIVVASCAHGIDTRLDAYEARVAECDEQMTAIVRREGTTEEEDLADLRSLRAECNADLGRLQDGGAR